MPARHLHNLFSLFSPAPQEPEEHGPGINLHRIDPLLFFNLFDALKRYDLALCVRLSREFDINLDRLQDLAVGGKLLGAGQLSDLLDALAYHPQYDNIVELAGRNSFAIQNERDGRLRRVLLLPQLARDIAVRMQPFMGESELEVELRGRVIMLRITNSIFAHDRFSLNGLCGFYVGYLQQLGRDYGMKKLDARETRCACQEEDQRCCLIHVAT